MITTDYNSNGHTVGLTGTLNGTPATYVSGISYLQYGLPTAMSLGNALTESRVYNDRLQLTNLDLKTSTNTATWSLVNCFKAGQSGCTDVPTLVAGNNGNMQAQKVNSAARTYDYDALNRLTYTSQGESYSYDRYGNRAVTTRSGLPSLTLETPTATTAYSNSSNRITSFGYDSRGNVTTVPGPNSTNIRIASYDAENHQTSETNVNGVSATYGYDGEGRRVTKTTAGVTTTFVYDAAGELVAEYGGTPSGTGRQFLTVDHLGSTRQITDASGAVVKTKDFLPFGEELNVACYSTDNGPGFTGQYGDKESCLDDFGARMLSSAQGRFTGVDNPKFSEKTDPQSWNLYGYVENNPLARIDPTGNNWFSINGQYHWYDGSDVDIDGNSCKRQSNGCYHSDYTHLLVFEKTSQRTKDGAAVGNLVLWAGNKILAKSTGIVFSGGSVANFKQTPDGNYEINLKNRGDLGSNKALPSQGGYELGAFHNGIQQVGEVAVRGGVVDFRDEWGEMRANLSLQSGVGTSFYLHGKNLYYTEGRTYTHGCICEPNQNVLRTIFKLDPSGVGEGAKNGRIAAWVYQKR